MKETILEENYSNMYLGSSLLKTRVGQSKKNGDKSLAHPNKFIEFAVFLEPRVGTIIKSNPYHSLNFSSI